MKPGSEEPKQQSVLVTGGASGIGLAIARGCLEAGWRVVVADLEQKNLEQARETLPHTDERRRFEQLDVADEESVRRVVARCDRDFGPLVGLVSSAGIGRDVPFLETTTDLFRKILEVNLIGSFVVAREAARCMRERGGGSIVNIASVSGIRGNIGRTAYGASKGGVITMTKVMAVELAPMRIRVNAIAPGPVETPLVQAIHTDEVRSEWMTTVPLRRYGMPDEMVGAALFLLDDRQSSFVTGQTICVDGGFTAGGLIGSQSGQSR